MCPIGTLRIAPNELNIIIVESSLELYFNSGPYYSISLFM